MWLPAFNRSCTAIAAETGELGSPNRSIPSAFFNCKALFFSAIRSKVPCPLAIASSRSALAISMLQFSCAAFTLAASSADTVGFVTGAVVTGGFDDPGATGGFGVTGGSGVTSMSSENKSFPLVPVGDVAGPPGKPCVPGFPVFPPLMPSMSTLCAIV